MGYIHIHQCESGKHTYSSLPNIPRSAKSYSLHKPISFITYYSIDVCMTKLWQSNLKSGFEGGPAKGASVYYLCIDAGMPETPRSL